MTPAERMPSPDDEDALLDRLSRDDTLQDASGMLAAGLLGAALGAGLGWLASRSMANEPQSVSRAVRETWRESTADPVRETVRDRMHDARRGVTRQRKRMDARAGEAADDVVAVARRTAAALERSRADAERQLERGLRDLRRAARRAAHRVG